MQPRATRRSGLLVTPIGLGMAALGRPAYLNLGHGEDLGEDRSVEALRDHAHRVLDAAFDGGVRYFDAARSYGRAEEFLASWLQARSLAPDEVTVASKWGYAYTADWRVDADTHEVKDHSPEALDRQSAESRGLLGDHLRLYQVHSATLDTGVLTDERVLARLAALDDEGVRVGLSVSGPSQADVVHQGLAAAVGGRNPFSAVQATWNPLEPSAAGALAEAHDAGWLVVIKEALANGRLTARNDDPAFLPKLRALQAVAQRHGTGIDTVALAASLAQPFADVVLSGAASTEHLATNLAAADLALPEEDLAPLEAFAEVPEAYWKRRAALPWQ